MVDILLTPEECQQLLSVKLPNPKSGELQYYFHDESAVKLYESTRYYDQYRSWFLDDLFCKQGHFNMLTPVDPLFILVPILKKLAGQQFRSLDDICTTYSQEGPKGSSRLDYALSPDIDWQKVCDVKQIDDQSFIRFNEDKYIEWLIKKHDRTMKALANHMSDDNPSKATLMSYAFDLIDKYVPDELSGKFKTQMRISDITKEIDQQKPKVEKASNNKPSARPKSTTDVATKRSKQETPKPIPKNQGGILKFMTKLK